MSKFDKFLEETFLPPQQEPALLTARSSKFSSKQNVSVKINVNTLNQLKILKTIEGFRSYSELINHLLESYVKHVGTDLANKIALLQD